MGDWSRDNVLSILSNVAFSVTTKPNSDGFIQSFKIALRTKGDDEHKVLSRLSGIK